MTREDPEKLFEEISKLVDKLDGTMPESNIDFEFLDALVCDNCGYHATSVLTLGSMCRHPNHPIMNVPKKKACKDHHLGTLPEDTKTELPLKQQFLKLVHTITDAERKYPSLKRSVEFALRYQMERKESIERDERRKE